MQLFGDNQPSTDGSISRVFCQCRMLFSRRIIAVKATVKSSFSDGQHPRRGGHARVHPCSGSSWAEYHTIPAHLLSPTPPHRTRVERCTLPQRIWNSVYSLHECDAANTVMPKVTAMIRRLEGLKADLLSRCGLISVSQFHSRLLHLADKSCRLCVKF